MEFLYHCSQSNFLILNNQYNNPNGEITNYASTDPHKSATFGVLTHIKQDNKFYLTPNSYIYVFEKNRDWEPDNLEKDVYVSHKPIVPLYKIFIKYNTYKLEFINNNENVTNINLDDIEYPYDINKLINIINYYYEQLIMLGPDTDPFLEAVNICIEECDRYNWIQCIIEHDIYHFLRVIGNAALIIANLDLDDRLTREILFACAFHDIGLSLKYHEETHASLSALLVHPLAMKYNKDEDFISFLISNHNNEDLAKEMPLLGIVRDADACDLSRLPNVVVDVNRLSYQNIINKYKLNLKIEDR